jgi:hypothetical protein
VLLSKIVGKYHAITEREYYSPTEYLELEVAAEERHEYIDGLIIPMTGGLPNRNQICLNVAGKLNYDLRKQAYRVFVTDRRLSIPRKWIFSEIDDLEVTIELESLPFEISLAEVYDKVDFDTEG